MILIKHFTILIKPASGNCNLRCRYCFYNNVTNSRKGQNHGMMQLDTMETIVRMAFSEVDFSCTFAFQGGEPTLAGIEFFRKTIEFQKKYNSKNITVYNTIQTNGYDLSEDFAIFFAENNFLVGLSIDATKEVHSYLRLDSVGNGTFSQCLKTAKLFNQYNVNYNILTVITKQLARHPRKVYDFYKNNTFSYVQFIPCIDDFNCATKDFSLDADLYGNFLCDIFDLWYSDFISGKYISIRGFDNYINILMGKPPENCGMSGVCTGYPTIEADGSVYPCDFYVLDKWCIGNIYENSFTSMLSSELWSKFKSSSMITNDKCTKCKYYMLCRGGCRRDREYMDELSLNKYCTAYEKFFDYCLSRMYEIAGRLV